jgi:hypothetical protein
MGGNASLATDKIPILICRPMSLAYGGGLEADGSRLKKLLKRLATQMLLKLVRRSRSTFSFPSSVRTSEDITEASSTGDCLLESIESCSRRQMPRPYLR